METMEFLSIMASHGQTKVLSVLTHLDLFTKAEHLRTTKTRLKKRLWRDLYPGAKLFYLSGVWNGRYPDREIHNLARFISVTKTRPIQFKQNHSFVLGDRWEDITSPLEIEKNPITDRTVSIYGYVRGGAHLREGQRVHVPGMNDFTVQRISKLEDPCKLERKEGERRRKLNDKMKRIYAPMSDVGGITFDQDAVYVELPGRSSGFTRQEDEEDEEEVELGEGERMVRQLQRTP